MFIVRIIRLLTYEIFLERERGRGGGGRNCWSKESIQDTSLIFPLHTEKYILQVKGERI